MRILPRISLPTHSLLELTAGLALVLAAAIADLGGAGTVAVFVSGVLLAGIGLGAAEQLPLSTLRSLDLTLVVALAAGAVGVALAGSAAAAMILLAVAGGLLLLESTTRWSRPARRA
jgi:hypothetical membrane protein